MARTYFDRVAGIWTQLRAIVTSAGSADSDKLVATDANGRLDMSLMPAGIAGESKQIQASESLSAPAIVNVFMDAGDLRVRNADASEAGKEASGFVEESVNIGETVRVFGDGLSSGWTGLTPGATYYLGTTPGDMETAAPDGAEEVVQVVGKAFSETELSFERGEVSVLAPAP